MLVVHPDPIRLARKEAEKGVQGPAAFQETAKAQLEQMKAEIAYRVAHANLAGAVGSH